jgi:rhamnosyl/mannosyltransferase
VGKYLPPFAGGMEHFLWDLLHAQHSLGIQAAGLVHHELSSWKSAEPQPADRIPVYRAPSLGRVLYLPIAPSFPLWLDRAIRGIRPDLLHLHLPNSSALTALMVASARRLPWVVHWHSDIVASELDRRLALAYRFYRPFEQWLLQRSRAIIATSPTYLDASPALQRWRARCHCIPLGLDPARLTNPTAAWIDEAAQRWRPGALRVLVIGRLTYYKGHEVLLHAMARTPHAQAVIVGTGERKAQLERLIDMLHLRERVLLRGSCSDAEVAALLAGCDLLALPSLERTEAFGLVLLEAMRFAKPVLVSDIPGSGVGWVVGQARNGLRVKPGDPDALAVALARLAEAPELRETLGRNGAQTFFDVFEITQIAEAIGALYQRMHTSRDRIG